MRADGEEMEEEEMEEEEMEEEMEEMEEVEEVEEVEEMEVVEVAEGGSSNEEEAETLEREQEEARQAFNQQQREQGGPRQRLIQQRQQEFADVEWLRRQLAQWINRCGLCEAVGQGSSAHDVRQCWRQESQRIKESIKRMEETIKFERYSGCFGVECRRRYAIGGKE
ncbi:hypothetical protein A1F94_006220 [Pyrenophora tritici-repentis]|nr:hypothetical protein A1F94_006220 [Pyrenophora tritici-repentis]